MRHNPSGVRLIFGAMCDKVIDEIGAEIVEALDMVRDAAPEDVVFVSGSLFLVAEARDTIGVPA